MKLPISVSCLAVLATAAALTGCGLSTNSQGTWTLNSTPPPGGLAQPTNGFRTQRTRDATDFHAINNQAVCNMDIAVGQPFKVVVEGDESVISEVSTEVKDGVLVINLDRNVTTNQPIRLIISMPKLDKYTNSGVGKATITNLKESFFTINQSGAGSLSADGQADMVDITMSGVGNADLSALNAKSVTALLSGTGSAKVYAHESLTATVSGIGKLTYSGNPPKVQKSVTGLGSITPQ
jgi:hypothetical protein